MGPLATPSTARRLKAGNVEAIAICVDEAWRRVELEPRQLADGEAFEVAIESVERIDRNADGRPELEIGYRFVESLTTLPPTGPYRRGRALLVVVDGAAALRVYTRGETDTAVATDMRTMRGAITWSPDGASARIVQTVSITEDVAEDGQEHGPAETSVDEIEVTARWNASAGRFEVEPGLWDMRIPGL